MKPTLRRTALTALCFVSIALSACSSDDKDAPLPGERISILDLQKGLEPDDIALDAQGFVAPQPWVNEFWPQAGGYPSHSMQNLSINGGMLQPAWQADIGDGASKARPLTAQPVVVDGKIFTLDTAQRLAAHDIQNGKTLWSASVGNTEKDAPVIGGGMSYSAGLLYVTNGYNELLAVNPQDGSIAWRIDLPAPSRAAPTILDGRVFVMTMDNRLVAHNAADGGKLWEYAGIPETAGLVGAAAPAASRDIVVPAFSSGEIYALRVENGSVAWSENLAAYRSMGGVAGLSDIRGLPVVDKGIVIAISFGGMIAAIDERTGDRIWQREFGGAETPWVAGNHIFVVSNDNELVAMGRDTGAIVWVTQLPRYEDPDDRKGPLHWTGPVLAGGRLILAGSNGFVTEVVPQTGEIVRQWEAGDSFSIAPVVAGETLYLLDNNGTLYAYR